MPYYDENPDMEAIKNAIENLFWRHQTSRLDIILLPISEGLGIFYVIYTVEYTYITNIGSIGLEKGIYYYDKENKIIKIQIGKFEKMVPLS
ncbi:hypothetical protein QIT30_gp07 [Saccharolobus solfataricus rod-shaped virus 1]|uniref:Uncharacterized protein n=1 Tax=Saccharolobus solfataricus rod-shaped virus 1 TaxID=2730619 RepID=A0A6M3VZF6_SSRV1|nr:hypothetical protein QIT30_gp07 [Saccharolobus solfataricus rod-shaped virus 1]QJF12283.1 hypothetical protein SSRV1_gp07 [Saccharolobus solfataricus rod-shaped virus 1]